MCKSSAWREESRRASETHRQKLMSQTPSITGAQWRVSTLGVGCHNWIWAAAIMKPLYFCSADTGRALTDGRFSIITPSTYLSPRSVSWATGEWIKYSKRTCTQNLSFCTHVINGKKTWCFNKRKKCEFFKWNTNFSFCKQVPWSSFSSSEWTQLILYFLPVLSYNFSSLPSSTSEFLLWGRKVILTAPSLRSKLSVFLLHSAGRLCAHSSLLCWERQITAAATGGRPCLQRTLCILAIMCQHL